jgi:hypothetical protein
MGLRSGLTKTAADATKFSDRVKAAMAAGRAEEIIMRSFNLAYPVT